MTRLENLDADSLINLLPLVADDSWHVGVEDEQHYAPIRNSRGACPITALVEELTAHRWDPADYEAALASLGLRCSAAVPDAADYTRNQRLRQRLLVTLGIN